MAEFHQCVGDQRGQQGRHVRQAALYGGRLALLGEEPYFVYVGHEVRKHRLRRTGHVPATVLEQPLLQQVELARIDRGRSKCAVHEAAYVVEGSVCCT
ncbi:hypothetical protein ACFQVC_03070 [Streptomyces monticola]|uniref:Uncharacterized protein n=1 Tax=Streptomyces monticola TaxID=2666263 RepID=A0ABW2JCD2_9ACTN